jgi:hypothetical protein
VPKFGTLPVRAGSKPPVHFKLLDSSCIPVDRCESASHLSSFKEGFGRQGATAAGSPACGFGNCSFRIVYLKLYFEPRPCDLGQRARRSLPFAFNTSTKDNYGLAGGRDKRKPTTYFLEKINRWLMPVRVDFCPYRSLEVVSVPSFPHLSE